ncbi:MAG: polynucleotide adenylyltransferase PcnB [Acidobacteriota bacterium]
MRDDAVDDFEDEDDFFEGEEEVFVAEPFDEEDIEEELEEDLGGGSVTAGSARDETLGSGDARAEDLLDDDPDDDEDFDDHGRDRGGAIGGFGDGQFEDDDEVDPDDFDDDFDEGDDDFDDEEDDGAPLILPRPDHSVSRKKISSPALKVLYRLNKTGYKAYLCGGAVRDLMLGGHPKDFDVATDARPHEIRRAFRNARIIGRRFRLAHVIFHKEVVEVSTFRRTPNPKEQASGPDEMLITNDNTFGTPLEDAFRRDFTVNALFYDIDDFSIVDYVGGVEDLESRLIRVIGEPDLRFCEDPVRMLRACEFAGRLGFTIEGRTQVSIERNRRELRKASPARLIEELLQLLRCGSAAAAVQWMLDLGLLEVILPEALAMIEADQRGAGSFTGILPTLDRMAQDGEKPNDSVLLGAILLPQLMLRRFEYESSRGRFMSVGHFRDLVEEAFESFLQRFSVAKHKRSMTVHALEGFHRLCVQDWTSAQRARFASKSYFDDALELFDILVRATNEGHSALRRWKDAQRKRGSKPRPHPQKRRRRRRPRRR